ncbi:MAG: hypothetical protein SH856_03010 [Flavobacteriales bacterium]|nr:hypothetical protein [Flavobacteriales bacterium]
MSYFEGKNILIISPEPWGISKVSKHHYAETLAKLGNRTWFLNPPRREYFKSESVNVVADNFHIPGTRFFPDTLQRMIHRSAAKKISTCAGTLFDVIWSFDNSRHYHLDVFEAGLKIHHMVDINSNFQLHKTASSADICFASNFEILELLKTHQPNSHFIPHGFASGHKQPAALPHGRGRTKIVYAGNLLIRFINWKLLHRLVKENSELDFFFIGSYGKGNLNKTISVEALQEVELLRKNENAFLLGEKPAGELDTMLAQADVLLICYDHIRFPAQVANAHKVMTYLASGKVIVSNVMDLYRPHRLLEMADNEESYLNLFRHVCNNLKEFNNHESNERRIAFAMSNTYQKQIARIEMLIENTL